ncbi:integral membrane protein [Colletotrichum zoysiae]|uniref:Integral membrane protein n=1 Tax=Colletotrichum zoysiae TaxID=1216348 RepID=A0AAD9HSZ6_9PEZI|nr:integral membrane protein [Colletotrichum zoysiae]
MKIWTVAVLTCLLLVTATTAQAEATNSTSPSALISKTPKCAVSCIIDGLLDGGCSVADATNCVCTNNTLRAQMSRCIQTSCIYADRMAIARGSRGLCRGYPIEDRRHLIRIASIALPIVTFVIFLMRCLSRFMVARKLWWDDWTALMAMSFLVVSCVLSNITYRLGFGLHYWDIDPDNGKTILQLFYASQMTYIMILLSAKASVCALYYRIFCYQWFRLAVRIFFVLLVIHGTLFLFLIMFQCVPISAVWDRSIDGRCLNLTAISFSGASTAILEDFILILFPIPALMKLSMGPRKRMGLMLLFGFGSFAIIASIIRLKYLVLFSHSYDPIWDYFNSSVWSAIEVNSAIICGSLPAIYPLIKKISDAFGRIRKNAESVGNKESTVTRQSQSDDTIKVSQTSRESVTVESAKDDFS